MKVFIVVGARGNGKSTFVKRQINDVPLSRLYVYDVQREYYNPPRALPDIDEFLQTNLSLTDSIVIYEEATVFFSNRGSNKLMRKNLIDARHNRNTIFLVFHSIRSIPFYIYDLTDYVVIFKTNDTEQIVKSKHELLYDAWLIVNRESEKADKLKLFNGTEVPYKIIKP